MKFLALLLFSAVAFAQQSQGHEAVLTWVDSVNPAGTTYNLWRFTGTCPKPRPLTTPPAGFTQVNTQPITAMNYADTTVGSATTYCYVLTAVAPDGNQSAPSGEAQATIPEANIVIDFKVANAQ